MLDAIHAKRDEIHSIAWKHKAEKLWVFGSVARKEERPDSDIDLLVKFSPDASFKDFLGIERAWDPSSVVQLISLRTRRCAVIRVSPGRSARRPLRYERDVS